MYKVQIRVDKDTQKCQQTEQKPSKKQLIQVKVTIIKEFFPYLYPQISTFTLK